MENENEDLARSLDRRAARAARLRLVAAGRTLRRYPTAAHRRAYDRALARDAEARLQAFR